MKKKKKQKPADLTSLLGYFLAPLFNAKSGTALGVLFVTIVTHFYSGIYADKKFHTSTQFSLLNKCEAVRNYLAENIIPTCLDKQEISKEQQKQRYKLRDELVRDTNTYGNIIKPNLFFSIAKLTRHDSSPAMRNICKFEQNQLKKLRSVLLLYCPAD